MKKTLTTLAVTLLTAKVALPATGAFAADFASTVSGTKDGNTTATVGIDAGELTLNSAPDLDFGSGHAITLGEQTYAAQKSTAVNVTDLTGAGTGWDLTVKQDGEFINKNEAILKGAEISLPVGSVLGSANGSEAVAVTPDGELSNGQAVTLVSGDVKAADKYAATFGDNSVADTKEAIVATKTALTIPAGAITTSGTYTTTLIWNVAPHVEGK